MQSKSFGLKKICLSTNIFLQIQFFVWSGYSGRDPGKYEPGSETLPLLAAAARELLNSSRDKLLKSFNQKLLSAERSIQSIGRVGLYRKVPRPICKNFTDRYRLPDYHITEIYDRIIRCVLVWCNSVEVSTAETGLSSNRRSGKALFFRVYLLIIKLVLELWSLLSG